MTSRRALAWPLVCALALAACGTPTSSGNPKPDPDAAADVAPDLAPDLAPPPDAPAPDAPAFDAAPDVAPDLAPPPDVPAPDVAPDLPADVAPEGPQCMPTELACDGRCVNAQTDGANCGACGNACPMGEMCMAGACRPVCPAGQSMCGTGCVDLQTSFGNCGACGVTCPLGQSCAAGRCQCPSGQMVCGAGCVDTSSDARHCGVCDNACPRGQMCSTGRCQTTCSAGQTLCNAATGPGECVDAQTSVSNCGRCGNACATGQTCAAGVCACPSGQAVCGGACVDTQRDARNCGACGTACSATESCSLGRCVSLCPPERAACAVVGGVQCADLQTDANHCGRCGNGCPTAQSCVAGVCSCPTGQIFCGGACVNPAISASNCGGCGVTCRTGEECRAGSCVPPCAAGQTACPAGAGSACVDTQTSAAHCGACGRACATGETCAAGACRVTATTNYRREERPSDLTFLNACTQPGASSYLAGADDSYTLVTMPFAFRYWATDRPSGSMVNITSNGWIGLDGVPSATYAFAIPSTATPNAVVAAYEGDDYNRNAQCVAVVGLAPSRRWVHTWNDSAHCCDPSTTGAHNTYSIYLNETTNVIEFVYSTMNGARSQWVGLENQTGSAGISGCPGGSTYNCTPVTGYSVRFVPIP